MRSVFTPPVQHSTEVRGNVIRQKRKKIKGNRDKILLSENLKDSLII